MTALSYVMSLMPPTIIRDLNLDDHGYHVIPMGPTFVAFPDGRYLLAHDDADPRRRRGRQVLEHATPTASPTTRPGCDGVADVLAPLLLRTPPRVGSRRPGDLLDQLRMAWGLRGLDVRGTAEATRLFTMSIRDVLDEWFESPEVKGVLAINGIIGTWAGPDEPGTAYVMMHHTIGDVGDGQLGSWGYPIGGMGAVSDADPPLGRVVRRRGPHRRRPSARIDVARRQGARRRPPRRATSPSADRRRRHPPADHVPPPDRPRRAARRLRPRPRALALPVRAPSRSTSPCPSSPTSSPGRAPSRTSGSPARSSCATRSTTSSGPSRTPARGGPSARPFSDGVIPSTLDPTLCPEGTHVMSLFTQWVPAVVVRRAAPAELEAYADRVIDGYNELAPNFKQSVIHRQVIGPYEMEHEYGLIGGNIFHGELSPDQLFHMRPAPGYADFTTPIDGLYQCSSATHGGGGVTGIPALLCTRRILADQRRRRLRAARMGADVDGESVRSGAASAPVDGADLAAVLDPRRPAACCRPRPTSTTASSPGSARTCSPAPGCAPGAAPTWRRRRPPGRRRRRRRRPPRARRRRRAARLLQRLPPPRPRAGPVRRRTSDAPLDPLPVPRLALRPRRRAAVDAALRRARPASTAPTTGSSRSRSRSGTAG